LAGKDGEIEGLKRKMKMTKIKELEVEVEEYQKSMISMKTTIAELFMEQRRRKGGEITNNDQYPQNQANKRYI
jgi:hypothetical protein